MTAGTQVRDWIHLDDVVGGLAAMVAAPLVQPGETIELGSGSPTSVADVVRLIYELSGSSGRPLIGALPTRPGETAHQEAELAAARERLGWHPHISLREGLGRLIDQMRQARSDKAPEE